MPTLWPQKKYSFNPSYTGKLYPNVVNDAPNLVEGEQSIDLKDYNYDLEPPGKTKLPWWETLIDIAAPALIGATSGEGAIPGAFMGYLTNRAKRGAIQSGAQKIFEGERKFRQKEREIDTESGLAGKKFDLESLYKKGMLDVSRQKALKESEPKGDVTDEDYKDAVQHIKQAEGQGKKGDPEAYMIKRTWEFKHLGAEPKT